MIISAFVLVTFASLLILWAEKDAADAQIITGADAFWWSVVTMTTVGFGDKVPAHVEFCTRNFGKDQEALCAGNA